MQLSCSACASRSTYSLFVCCSGSGAAGAAGLTDQVDIIIGTLSKGFGAHGGFVACDAPLQRLLLSAARTYMFSTALPLPLVAAAHAALEVSQKVLALGSLLCVILSTCLCSTATR